MTLYEKIVMTDEEIIQSSEKFFKFFAYLPKIATIFFAIAFFIAGFACSVALEDAIWLSLWPSGAVFCLLNYVFLNLILSYKILHIYYLKKISSNTLSLNTVKKEETDVLPEI